MSEMWCGRADAARTLSCGLATKLLRGLDLSLRRLAAGAMTGLCMVAAQASDAPIGPIFVLNSLDSNVSVIDPLGFNELRRIPTGKQPHHLYLTPDNKTLIIGNAGGDSLTLIDPLSGALKGTIAGIADPYHLRFSPDMNWFVIAANRLNRVDIYRWDPQRGDKPLTLAAAVPAARTPSHLAIDSQSKVVYASLQDSDQLIAIDLATHKPRWTVRVGKMPADIYLTPDDRLLLVALTGDEFVEVYDVSLPVPQRVQRIRTGAGAHAFRSRGDDRHVFVSNRVANTISKIDLKTLAVVDEYAAPGGPDCIDTLGDGKTLLVTSRWARKLTYIDTEQRRVIRQVDVGRSPHGVWTLDHAPRR